MSTFFILVEFLEKGHEIFHFWEIPQVGTGYPNSGGTNTTKHNQSGTGTKTKWYRYQHAKPKWYRYQDKVVSVPTYRTEVVLVLIKVIPVPMLPTTLIFVFVH